MNSYYTLTKVNISLSAFESAGIFVIVQIVEIVADTVMLLTANNPSMVSYAKPARVLGETALVLSEGSALVKACWLGRLRLVRLLVDGGTEVNNGTEEGRTALMASCMTTYRDTQTTPKLKVVKYLLEHKADPNIQDKYGKTALMYACIENADIGLVTLLLEHKADPKMTDHTGSSAIVYAINAGNSSILTLLIDSCRSQGCEVIIVSTKNLREGLRSRETKQHLGVPPVLPGSPPFYQCITPSDVEFKTSVKSDDFKSELSQSENNIASPFQITVPQISNIKTGVPAPQLLNSNSNRNDTSVELDCWNRLGSREMLPSVSPKQSPSHSKPKQLTPNDSSLYKRRLHNRESSNSKTITQEKVPDLALDLKISASNSPTENADDKAGSLCIDPPLHQNTPILNISTPDQNQGFQLHPRKPLIRRQSAEIIRFRTMLHDIHEHSGQNNSLLLHGRRLPLSEGCSPEESMSASPATTPQQEGTEGVKLPEIEGTSNQVVTPYTRRYRSLPRKPPPLRKSQTCHVIKCPLDLIKDIESNKLRDIPLEDVDAQSARSDSAIEMTSTQQYLSSKNGSNSPRGTSHKDPRKRRLLQRRGSMPHLLNDKLSRQRPGTLPPLKINPHPPIPDIGSRFENPPVLKRQTSDLSGPFDRSRMALQVDDMQKVMDSMKDISLQKIMGNDVVSNNVEIKSE